MTTPTFYVPDPGRRPAGGEVRLPEDEARHARSLRVRPGDEVRVTDGAGRLWRARLEAAPDSGGEGMTCTLLEALDPPPRLPVELGFGVAAKDRTLWMVEKAVELGVASLQPVECRRSRSVADAGRSPAFWRKAARRARSALKQCGGARLPDFGPVRDLHEYLGRSARPGAGGELARSGPDVLLDREGRRLADVLDGWSGEPPLRLLLGPEGGLEDEERAACLQAGFTPASLGPRVLRFETAAVAALAVAGQRAAGDRGPGTSRGTAGTPSDPPADHHDEEASGG